MVDASEGWSVKEELQLPHWKVAARQILRGLTPHQRYLDLRCGAVQAELRWSVVPRRGDHGPLDVDIVKIQVDHGHRRQGVGTRFCITLAVVVDKLFGRGLYLEQCITPSSHALALRLLKMGWFYHPKRSEPSVLAHHPPAAHVPASPEDVSFTPAPRAFFELCEVCDGPVRPPDPCMTCAFRGGLAHSAAPRARAGGAAALHRNHQHHADALAAHIHIRKSTVPAAGGGLPEERHRGGGVREKDEKDENSVALGVAVCFGC